MANWFKQGLLIFVLSLTYSCSQGDHAQQTNQWMIDTGRLKVLSTTGMINDLVKQIGQQHIDSLVLIKGDLDPHSYQLVKGDDEKFTFADLIFFNGLGLEHGPSLQRHLLNNPKSIALGDKVRLAHPETIVFFQGQLDPHIWMDISLWAKTIPFIVEALSAKDPIHAADYKQNGERLLQRMTEVHEVIKQHLAAVPADRRFLVTSHDAFNYFTRAYLATPEEVQENTWQKRFAAPEGLAPDSQLSTTDIQNIISHLTKFDIHVLFPESNVSKDSIKKIVDSGKEKGLSLHIAQEALYADAMGPPGTDGATYLDMIHHNARVIAQELQNGKE